MAIIYETHAGLAAITAPIVKVKLVPAVRAVTTGFVSVESVVLQVVEAIVKLSSTVRVILLFAVTAVVLTTNVGFVPVGSATAPVGADPQTAGEAPLEQFVADLNVVRVGEQFHSTALPVDVMGHPLVPADVVES